MDLKRKKKVLDLSISDGWTEHAEFCFKEIKYYVFKDGLLAKVGKANT